jgi:signal transduction histidine kinase
LGELFNEILEPYQRILSDRITFKIKHQGDDFTFYGDKEKIKIALKNVITNAIEAIPNKGTIQIRIMDQTTALDLDLEDSGIGISSDKLDKIFEPYFSTKEVGTGLGLPIAKKIIEDHKGLIKASSKKNEGTKIFIHLPRLN